MSIYAWKGKNRFGDVVAGERVASTPDEVARSLRREQIAVVNITKKKTEIQDPL